MAAAEQTSKHLNSHISQSSIDKSSFTLNGAACLFNNTTAKELAYKIVPCTLASEDVTTNHMPQPVIPPSIFETLDSIDSLFSGLSSVDFLNSVEPVDSVDAHCDTPSLVAYDEDDEPVPQELTATDDNTLSLSLGYKSQRKRGNNTTEGRNQKKQKTDWLGEYRRVLSSAQSCTRPGDVLPPSVVFATARSSKRETATLPTSDCKCNAVETVLCTPPNPGEEGLSKKKGSKRCNGPAKKFLNEQEPAALDVLGGRGGGANNHVGNIRYWKKVLALRPQYRAVRDCNTAEKTRIAEMVLTYIQNGPEGRGRFVERDMKTRRLFLIPDEVALSKIKQALRDNYVPLFAR